MNYIDRIQENAQKEIREIEDWLCKLSRLRLSFMGDNNYNKISEIIKRNQIERLSLAVDELESMKAEMQKDFARSVENKPREEKVEIAKNFASTILEIEDREELLLGSLGVKVDEKREPASNNKELAFLLIEDLEERFLTEKDELLLKEAKEFFEQGNYSLALRTVSQAGQQEENGDVESEDEENENESENKNNAEEDES